MRREPFTKEEKEIMDLLVKAHNKFIQLERDHPQELNEWINAFHILQNALIYRIVKRDYPEVFS